MTRLDPDQLADFTRQAEAYLAAELRGPPAHDLELAATFNEQPFEGEGFTAMFRFMLPPSNTLVAATAGPELPHVVFVGETEPNYYPTYGLDVEQAYSLHIGTRFMLTMQLTGIGPEEEPTDARDKMRKFVAQAAPGAELTADALSALFRCEDQFFAVYRLGLDDEQVYFIGGDAPPGFYRLPDLPPAVILRLHLGQLIRAEARQATE